MLFSSPTFLFIFLPAVFLLNLLTGKKTAWSNALLIAASLLFYAWGEPVYVLFLLAASLAYWGIALLMARFNGAKKALCALAVLLGAGALVFFKYANFLIASFNALTGLSLPRTGAALPIGISFFLFEAMSYALDVYRGKTEPARNFFDVLLYIALFPTILAGPIVRFGDIAPQLRAREVTWEDRAVGFRRFAFGMAKKALLANTLLLTADAVFALPGESVNAPIAWLGALAYLLQIYFDFSGYSDMAIGLARAFGFRLRENFDYPYMAVSMQDFWRRWHISLSSWFRDYVYIPLGGNRKGKLRTGLNKLAVFLLTGLWHGASWTFAAWGLFHGGFLMLEGSGALRLDKWPKPLRRVYTLLVVTVSFVLFRAETFGGFLLIAGNMFAGWRFTPALAAEFSRLATPLALFALIAGGLAAGPFAKKAEPMGARAIGAYAAAFALFVLSVLALSTSSYNPFIYFQF